MSLGIKVEHRLDQETFTKIINYPNSLRKEFTFGEVKATVDIFPPHSFDIVLYKTRKPFARVMVNQDCMYIMQSDDASNPKSYAVQVINLMTEEIA